MPVLGSSLLSAAMISATMSRYHIHSCKLLPPGFPHFQGKAAHAPLQSAYSSIPFWLLPFFLLQLKSHLVWLLLILFLETVSLCNLCWPEIQNPLPASNSRLLLLQICTTTPGWFGPLQKKKFIYFFFFYV